MSAVDESNALRKRILDNTIEIFNEKGLKCTMDDIAKSCGISKKTIYTVYADKEELFLAMVDYLFDGIKQAEAAVLVDNSLDLIGKIRRIMGAMPESYAEIDFTKLSSLKEKQPTVYMKMAERLESGWETTIELLEEAKRQGLIRQDASIPILKLMMESSIEHFFQDDVLARNNMSYTEGLSQVVDILIDGILERN